MACEGSFQGNDVPTSLVASGASSLAAMRPATAFVHLLYGRFSRILASAMQGIHGSRVADEYDFDLLPS